MDNVVAMTLLLLVKEPRAQRNIKCVPMILEKTIRNYASLRIIRVVTCGC